MTEQTTENKAVQEDPMTEFTHPKPGDVLDSWDVVRLLGGMQWREGTILKAEGEACPIWVTQASALILNGAYLGPKDIKEYGRFQVLYVPPVELPPVGVAVTRERLDMLPVRAVVQDSPGGTVYQKSDQDFWVGEDLSNDYESPDRGGTELLWDVTNGQLTLLWLPVEPHKG